MYTALFSLSLFTALAAASPVILPRDLSAAQQQVLDRHNEYRSQHSAPALTWNSDLEQYAQQYADKCVFQHSGGQYGENLAAGTGSTYNMTTAVDDWYAEGKDYNYNSPAFSENTGHFTQVVWMNSKELGCAISSCTPEQLGFGINYGNEAYNIVCEYNPPGNYGGEYARNVLQS